MTYSYPLISCVMPTYNRRRYVPAAIRCFQAQTYPNKELVVVDNGTEPVADLIPYDSEISYYRLDGERKTTGAMRNSCAERAKGSLLAHWDDDDYSHPRRLMEQHRLMLSMSVSVVGFNEMYFVDEDEKKAWLYRNQELYAMGTSLMYPRDYWKAHRFPDLTVAEDTAFIYNAQHRRAMSCRAAGDRMIARIHSQNTCNKDYLCEPMWTAMPYFLVLEMIPETERVCEAASA